MKILLGVITLCWLFAGDVMAQRGGRGGGFRGGFGGFHGGFGSFRGHAGRFGRGAGERFLGNGSLFGNGLSDYGLGYPTYYGDYGAPMGDVNQSAPGNVIVVPVLPPEPPPPPPPPARPVIHEYQWPNTSSEDTATTFAIVTKDNVTHYATMVWIDGDQLRFIDSHGGSGRLSRASISHDLTYQANSGKNLKAWLP